MLPALLFLFLCFPSTFLATGSCPQVKTCTSLLQAGKRCPLFPMLPGTFALPPGPQGFILTPLRSGVFHYSDDAYHAMIFFSAVTRRLVVIDFPRSQNSFTGDGSYLLNNATIQVLRGAVPKQVDMVYSHRHFDHIGSAGVFKTFVEKSFPETRISVWGTKETHASIRRNGKSNVPLPNIFIGKRGRTLAVSTVLKLELSILGGHTNSDLLTYIRPSKKEKGVVHYVDVVQAGEAPFVQFTLTIDLGRYLEVHKRLLNLKFEYISTGHGKIGVKNDVRRSLSYTKFVMVAARQSAKEITAQQAGAYFGRVANKMDVAYRNGAWALKSVLDLQVELCERKVISRWGCELSVVDVFAKGHCLSAVLYNFVDQ